MIGDYICRVCESTRDLEIIFKDENQIVLQMLRTIADVSIEPHDTLPNCICNTCTERLKQAHDFRTQCKKTDTKLRKLTFTTNYNHYPPDLTTVKIDEKISDSESDFEPPQGQIDPLEVCFTGIKQDILNEKEEHENIQNKINDAGVNVTKTKDDEDKVSVTRSGVVDADDGSENDGGDDDDKDPEYRPPSKVSKPVVIDAESDDESSEAEEKPTRGRKKKLPPIIKPPKRKRQYKRKIVDGMLVYECIICRKSCNQRTIWSHVETHGERHICQLCGKQYSQRNGLNRHIRDFHKQKKPHECEICGKRFPRTTALRLHINTHSSIRMYKCDGCDKRFKSLYYMKAHRKTHETYKPPENPTLNSNGNAPLNLTENSDLKSLSPFENLDGNNHNSQVVPSYVESSSDEETKEFLKKAKKEKKKENESELLLKNPESISLQGLTYKRHLIDSKILYECLSCKKTLRKRGIWSHAETHGEPLVCQICGKQYSQRNGLNRHIRHFHNQLKLHECKVCGRRFSRSAALKMHLSAHSDEKNFQCDGCDKKFKYLHCLKIHKRTHIQKLECEICRDTFDSHKSYKDHMQVHSEHECPFCSKRFTTAFALKIHQIVHQTEKTYNCDMCRESFKRLMDLDKHKLIHRNDVCQSTTQTEEGI